MAVGIPAAISSFQVKLASGPRCGACQDSDVGFFDCKCMLTGVSVDWVGAVVVVLRCTPAGYQPISLGIKGEYDGYGSIFPERDDRASELLCGYLEQQERNGRLVIKLVIEGNADDVSLQGFLGCVMDSWVLAWPSGDEPFTPMPITVLDGDTLVYAMIAQPIWDAIVAAGSGPGTLDDAFGDCAIPREIYGAHVAEIGPELHALARIAEFIRAHDLRWAPPADPDQRYPSDGDQWGEDENAELIAQACRDYLDSPEVLAGLDEYAARLEAHGFA